jgi:cell division protease FtsH
MFMPESFASGGKTYSEEKAAEIDNEISTVMEEAHRRVREILSDRRKILDDLAKLLLEKEIVQGEELRKMLAKPERPALPGGEKGLIN